MTSTPIIELQSITRSFKDRGGLFSAAKPPLQAVRDASITIKRGETVALVGESGSGKTTLGKIAALLDAPSTGHVLINGKAPGDYRTKTLRPFRQRVQMIFQDPFASLNPRRTIGEAIAEPLVIHNLGSAAEIQSRVSSLLDQVGLSPEDARRYPHQFSGGQRQRIAIARALALEPEVLIADEAVSALDVSVQSQILNLIKRLQQECGIAVLFISHDLDVVRHIAERTLVMYLGAIVEDAVTESLFAAPRHPYTEALLAAKPKLGAGKRKPGQTIMGEPPSPIAPPNGCAFHPRCPKAIDQCYKDMPVLKAGDGMNSAVACWVAEDQGS